jgi:hypothetical protein
MTKHWVPPQGLSAWDAENAFYLQSPPSRLAKLLSQLRLYEQILNLPGSVVECGVFKGSSLLRFATFRHLLENQDSRPIYGFDAFGAFPRTSVSSVADQEFIERFESDGGAGISRGSLEKAVATKGFQNVHLLEGDIFSTIPEFLARSPALRVAMLHLDLDVYEPTKFALEQFLPRMVPSGIIVFDDYSAVEGATRVADELCRERGLTLHKLPYYTVPAFLRLQSR